MQRADIYYIPFEGGGTRLEVVRCGPRRGRAMLRRLWVHAGSVRRAMQSSAGLHLPKALYYAPNRPVGAPTQLALQGDFRPLWAREVRCRAISRPLWVYVGSVRWTVQSSTVLNTPKARYAPLPPCWGSNPACARRVFLG